MECPNQYEISEEDINKIENRFTYHEPFGTQKIRYETIRAEAKKFAIMLQSLCPKSVELTLALRNLEQCVQDANCSIARNEKNTE